MKRKKPDKQRNHVAQHSRNKPGAGAHKDKTKYDRKERKKDGQRSSYEA